MRRMSDDEFLSAFENCTLEPFHHADHVRMAFLYLTRYPALEAIGRFSGSLQRFAAARGKPQLYHETITWAFLFLIRERLARGGNGRTWEEFSSANADLLDWKESVLKKYYRDETLRSALARGTFLMPDRVDAGGRDGDAPRGGFFV
jgi:hypothetical protein